MTDIDHAAIYRDTRIRVTEIARACTDEVLDRTAPATPKWRARDIVSHLSGATADAASGNLDGVATERWTQAQVDARRDTPIADVLDEWTRCAELIELAIPDLDPIMRVMLLTDAVTHEHDLRGAVDQPGARDSAAIGYAFQGVSRAIGPQRAALGAGPLRIVHEAGEIVLGDGDPTATLRTSRFEVVRAAVGRRSLSQIAAWDWEGDAQPESVVLARFAPTRPDPLIE